VVKVWRCFMCNIELPEAEEIEGEGRKRAENRILVAQNTGEICVSVTAYKTVEATKWTIDSGKDLSKP
jgi:hypothetical protein